MDGQGGTAEPQGPATSNPPPQTTSAPAPTFSALPPAATAINNNAPVAALPPAAPPSRAPRAQKTPAQKQALEEAFQNNERPNDQQRKELAATIGLTEQQVSTWFTHRRRKARQEAGDGGGQTSAPGGKKAGEEWVDEPDPVGIQQLAEYKELLELAATIIPNHRPNGPPLGMYFDDVPAKAGGGNKRKAGTKDDDPEFRMGGGGKRGKSGSYQPSASVLGVDDLSKLPGFGQSSALLAAQARMHVQRLEESIKQEQQKMLAENAAANYEAARRLEKEMARLEAERRRNLERYLKEQRKEEERRFREQLRLKAMQEKEERRLAVQLEKEKKAEERRREIEERKKERAKQRALNQQERAAMRMRARDVAGPKDDLEVEWEALASKYRASTGLPADIPVPAEGSSPPEGYPPLPSRPPFPPPSITFIPAASQDTGLSDDHSIGDFLGTWTSLMLLREIIGIPALHIETLLTALHQGQGDAVLPDIHIGLLRLIQADAEEAHNSGIPMESREGAGKLLEEAWNWGFDINIWRAHLNRLTWPEIARQVAIAAGLGRKRPQPRRQQRALMGVEGEDVIVDTPEDFQLALPPRLNPGTVKGAAWLVLHEAGPEGLHCEEIARRIQNKGLRDLRTSKTPETSVSGALAKDVVFERVAPATFALTSIRARARKIASGEKLAAHKTTLEKAAEAGEGAGNTAAAAEHQPEKEKPATTGGDGSPAGDNNNTSNQDHQHDGDFSDEESDEEAEARRQKDEAHQGDVWVAALLTGEYDSLSMELRISMLSSLCQLALETPTVREIMEKRLEERQRLKRQLFEEQKAEAAAQRQKKAAEAAAKAKAAAEEAQLAVLKLNAEIAQATGAVVPHNTDNGPAPMDVDNNKVQQQLAKQPSTDSPAGGSINIKGRQATTSAAEETNEERAAAKKRQQERAEQTLHEVALYSIRAEPLGLDRRHNRYWRMALLDAPDASDDRIFFESAEDGSVKLLASADGLKELMAGLLKKGPREGALHASLLRYKDVLERAMPAKPLTLQDSKASSSSAGAGSSYHCLSAAEQLELLDESIKLQSAIKLGSKDAITKPYVEGESPEITKLKSDMMTLGGALSSGDALDTSFELDIWSTQVETAPGNVAVLLNLLAQLQDAVLPTRLHPAYNRKPALVRGAWIHTGDEVAHALHGGELHPLTADHALVVVAAGQQQVPNATAIDDNNVALPPSHSLRWVPPTIAALSVRVQALDASVAYVSGEETGRETMDGYRFSQPPPAAVGGKKKQRRVQGLPIDAAARYQSVQFPPFPYRHMYTPRVDFTLNVPQFKADVAIGSDALVAVAAPKGPGKGRGGRGRGGRGGGGGIGGRGAGGRGGGNTVPGRGSGSKKQRGGNAIGGSGRGGSALNKEFNDVERSDSERHYGSDFDMDDEDELFGFTSGDKLAMRGGSGGTSAVPSAAPSTGGKDEDEEISVDSQAGDDQQEESSSSDDSSSSSSSSSESESESSESDDGSDIEVD